MSIRLSLIFLVTIVLSSFGGPIQAAEVEGHEDEVRSWLTQEGLEFYGSLELEVRTEEGFTEPGEDSAKKSETDLSLEAGVLVRPQPWLGAQLQITWDDESPLEIEEANVTLGNPELFPFYLTGGKMTLPFGRYESTMVSDPLTLEIGETIEDALLLGCDWRGLRLAVFAYDGSTNGEKDSDDGLKSFGGDLGYLWGAEDLGLLLGGSWISNLADSDGLVQFLDDEDLVLRDRVPGMAAYTQLFLEPLILTWEYVVSLENPVFLEEDEFVRHDRQRTWVGEGSLSFEVMDIESNFAASYGWSGGLVDVLPKKRLGCALTVVPFAFTRLAIEYLREEDYSVREGGTGDGADVFTVQVALEYE